MPFCHFTIKASRTAIRFRSLTRKGFRSNPQTLGQHLLARRLVLSLTQKEVATQLLTVREHYERWERDEVEPTISFWPKLIAFLGYYPCPEETSSAWVLRARRLLGVSQFDFGRRFQVIAQNIRRWEKGLAEPSVELLEKIKVFTSTNSCH